MNGLLRDYFPKGTDLGTHSPQHLLAVETELYDRPRRVLNDHAPAERHCCVDRSAVNVATPRCARAAGYRAAAEVLHECMPAATV
jgi:hypothetical protein